VSARLFCITVMVFFLWFLLRLDTTTTRFNFSSSMPKGWYRTVYKAPQVGDTITLCLPFSFAQFAYQRHYIDAGACPDHTQPLVKKIVAGSGDVVVVTKNTVRINGLPLPHSARLSYDSKGRFMPAIALGVYHLQASEVWLYGVQDAHSWDSRYFGPIEKKYLRQVVVPTLIG
jgi:conjugative transfer signal peptidase TraF